MDVWMHDRWMEGWMKECMCGWMDAMDRWMDGWVDDGVEEWMKECMCGWIDG